MQNSPPCGYETCPLNQHTFLHHSPVQRSQAAAGISSVCVSFVCSSPFPYRLQLRKEASSLSAAQSGDSPAASTPADTTPHLPESAAEEAEVEGPEGKIDGEAEEEAPKGAAVAQESTAKQDGVCG